eukprot:gene17238-20543_t
MSKPFIDKKNKQVFSVYKSTSIDRHGRELNELELIEKKKYEDDDGEYYDDDDEEYYDEEDDDEEDDDLYKLGLNNDGYDYSKHMKPIGGGVFIPAIYDVNDLKKHKGGILELVTKSEPAPYMYGLEEISRGYVKSEAMGDEDDDFEDLDDDFIMQANGGTLDGLNDEINATRKRLAALDMLDDDDEEDEDGERRAPRVETRQRPVNEILEAQFDAALAEYDDDEIGELDPESTRGNYTTDAYKEVFEEFIEDYERNHESLMEQINILKRADPTIIPLSEEEKRAIVERDWEAEELIEVDDDEEEEEEKEKWDCETILTTYSNIYNHPAKIQEVKPIKLKRGMPVFAAPVKKTAEEEEEEEEEDRVNLGAPRGQETKEEKRLRKKAIKDEKKASRETKKEFKQAFKSEEMKQVNVLKAQKLNKLVSIQY